MRNLLGCGTYWDADLMGTVADRQTFMNVSGYGWFMLNEPKGG